MTERASWGEFECRLADLRLSLSARRFSRALDDMVRKYRPDQLRVPKGTPEGGEWAFEGGIFRKPDAQSRILVAQVITPDRMAHIIGSHGFGTRRTRPGNSIFLPQYSTPLEIQSLANDLFARRIVPKPWRFGDWYEMTGDFYDVDLTSGATTPHFVGLDGNGHLTNVVRIRFNPATSIVDTMFPVSSSSR